jgi:hypothetical protein
MWFLQTPKTTSEKLLGVLAQEAVGAIGGLSAFAFITAAGVKYLASENSFTDLLAVGNFTMIVGVDAITDENALSALSDLQGRHPNFTPLAFLHSAAGSLFHPKATFFRRKEGGVIVTGSGNLTSGGLKANWEAFSVDSLSEEQAVSVENMWREWIAAHSTELLPLSDARVVERAKSNGAQRQKIKKALQLKDGAEPADEVLAEAEGAVAELSVSPVLIAEVPRSGDRWKQVNFDIATYQNFFGVTIGLGKDVEFREVRSDGTLGPAEQRHAVSVRSQNYRFEVGAASNLPYPASGNPIVVFQKVTDALFYYVLLMPPSADHALMQGFVDAHYKPSAGKVRAVISMGTLQSIWPSAPFFT